MKIKLHPLFFLLAGVFLVLGQFELLCGYLISIVAHEVAHNRMAKLRGYGMGVITIMPYGGSLECGDDYNDSDNILIALSAPLFNLTVATFTVALWWLLPDVYAYTRDLCMANLSLGLVNLLPLYPLDGSRVVISLVKKKTRAVKILKWFTVVAGAVMFVGGIVGVFFTLNITLPIFGLFLILSGVFTGKSQSYFHLANSRPFLKDYTHGLNEEIIYIAQDSQLFKFLRFLGKDKICRFILVDSKGDRVCELEERTLEKLCLSHELSVTAVEALQDFNS
ncbi:MAG: hypothetical protein OSJ74_06940 [Clostridia bacterium]|nr:hypothetical protein [Clostridia bacterium]